MPLQTVNSRGAAVQIAALDSLDAPLLIEQPSLNDLWRVKELVMVASLVRFDLRHVERSWRHGSQERMEIVEIALARSHERARLGVDAMDGREPTFQVSRRIASHISW